MGHFTIDINVDVGEGLGNEALILPYISSCNIACGGHAGDLKTMREVVKLAKKHQVKIGAHPSFPDRENFGRLPMRLSHEILVEVLVNQITNLNNIIANQGDLVLHHIKPHGALYNMAATTESVALSVLEAVSKFPKVKLYAPYGSIIAELAEQKHIPIVFEVFADRNYNVDLTLVSREKDNAIIADPVVVFNHVLKMLFKQRVKAVNGVEVELKADTYCFHGDHPKAVEMVVGLAEKLKKRNVIINKLG